MFSVMTSVPALTLLALHAPIVQGGYPVLEFYGSQYNGSVRPESRSGSRKTYDRPPSNEYLVDGGCQQYRAASVVYIIQNRDTTSCFSDAESNGRHIRRLI
jgi:hypothetical protein